MGTPSEALCLDCGLCCDGSLFVSLRLRPEEGEHASAVGADGQPCLAQPCRHFAGHCTIYPDRFRGCHVFQCIPLRQVRAGTLSTEAARATIADTRGAIDTLSRRMGEPAVAAARLRAKACAPQWRETADPAERARLMRLVLDLAALDRTIAQRFLPKGPVPD